MIRFFSKARTALALGLPNVARAVSYRLGVKLGLNSVQRLRAAVPQGPFFKVAALPTMPVPGVREWRTSAHLFGHLPFLVTTQPPDWVANPITGQRVTAPGRGW